VTIRIGIDLAHKTWVLDRQPVVRLA